MKQLVGLLVVLAVGSFASAESLSGGMGKIGIQEALQAAQPERQSAALSSYAGIFEFLAMYSSASNFAAYYNGNEDEKAQVVDAIYEAKQKGQNPMSKASIKDRLDQAVAAIEASDMSLSGYLLYVNDRIEEAAYDGVPHDQIPE